MKPLFIVLTLMIPALISLGCAWAGQSKNSDPALLPSPRTRAVSLGVVLGTLSQLISFPSLIHFLQIGHPAKPHPPTLPWLVINWLAIICWIIALCAGLIGFGRSRLALLIWTGAFAFAIYFVAMSSFD